MKKESERKLVIVLIIIFVIILAVFLIVWGIDYSIKLNSGDTGSENLNIEQMTIDCIDLGCPTESQSIYAGSENSDKYYECDCGYAKNILPENLVCFASDEDALADDRIKSEC